MEARHPQMRAVSDPPGAARHLWQIAAVRDVCALLAVIGVVWMVYWLRGIFLPIFAALVLAYLFNPIISYVERRWGWPRPLTAAVLIGSVLVAVAGFISWLGPLLFQQGTLLAGKFPDYIKTLAAQYHVDIGDFGTRIQEWMRVLQSEPQQIVGQLFSSTGRAVGIVTFIFGIATHWLLSLLLIVLYSFLFSWHLPTGLQHLSGYIPETRKPQVFGIGAKMDQAVGEFFRGRLLIAFLVGIFLSAGWYFTAVPYWFFLGMLTGVLTIVPYLALLSWPVAIALKYVDTLMNGGGQVGFIGVVVWPSVIFCVVEFLEGWVLTPWIQSGKTELSAATIILVVFIGEAVAGIWGMLFAIPVAACIKILLNEIALPRLRSWALTH